MPYYQPQKKSCGVHTESADHIDRNHSLCFEEMQVEGS